MLAELSPASVAMVQRWAGLDRLDRHRCDEASRAGNEFTVRGDAEVDIVAGCCSRAFGIVKPFLEHVKLPHTVRGF